MRVALISLIGRAADAPEIPLASLVLAGRSLAERQLELVLALGCERIVCLSQGLDRNMIALQHRAEAAGAKFNLIAGPRPLAGLVNTADELLVVAEGLLPAAPEATAALESGAGVLVLPVETGVAAGFERIDLNHAWAGVLVMPGRLVERLNQLPSDCDAVSALLRIALQGRVQLRSLPEAVLTEQRWALLNGKAQLAELEPEWFRRHVAPASPYAPGRALARIAMRGKGAKLLEKGCKPGLLAAGGVGLAAIGLMAASFGLPITGIAACGLGWVALEAGAALTSIARAGLAAESGLDRTIFPASLAIDLLLIAIVALALPGDWPERIYPALVLMGAARGAGALIAAKWGELLQDRAALALLLILAALAHALLPAIQLLSLAAIGAILGLGRITRA